MSIHDFYESEVSKMTRLEKLFSLYPEMHDTKELAYPAKRTTVKTEKVIRPSLLHRFFSLVFLFFSLGFFAILLNMLAEKILIPVTLFGIVFVGAIIGILIWNSFLNRNYNYKIKLTKDYIEIDKNIIPWSEISETEILRRKLGRGRNSYLVIFCKNGQVHKHSLFNFDISDEKLSKLIETYKQYSTSNGFPL
jgi:hypothetical protein